MLYLFITNLVRKIFCNHERLTSLKYIVMIEEIRYNNKILSPQERVEFCKIADATIKDFGSVSKSVSGQAPW